MSKFSVDDLLNSWKADLQEEGTLKYIYQNRKNYLEDLVMLFRKFDIDFEDAKMAKRKVQEVLITKEGMKGKGKHTGWSKSVEDDFKVILSKYYVDSDTSKIKPLEDADKAPWWQFESDIDGEMKEWVTKTYGYSDEIYLETKRVGSFFWMEYLEAIFSR